MDGEEKKKRTIRKPYSVFDKVEEVIGLPLNKNKNPKERSKVIWECLVAVWQETRSGTGLRQFYQRHRSAFKFIVCECLHDDYAKGCRARWLCTLRIMFRVHLGALAVILWGRRPHITFLLRLGPIHLLILALNVQNNNGE